MVTPIYWQQFLVLELRQYAASLQCRWLKYIARLLGQHLQPLLLGLHQRASLCLSCQRRILAIAALISDAHKGYRSVLENTCAFDLQKQIWGKCTRMQGCNLSMPAARSSHSAPKHLTWHSSRLEKRIAETQHRTRW